MPQKTDHLIFSFIPKQFHCLLLPVFWIFTKCFSAIFTILHCTISAKFQLQQLFQTFSLFPFPTPKICCWTTIKVKSEWHEIWVLQLGNCKIMKSRNRMSSNDTCVASYIVAYMWCKLKSSLLAIIQCSVRFSYSNKRAHINQHDWYFPYLYTSCDHIIVWLPCCIYTCVPASVDYSLKKAAIAVLHHTINYCFCL